MVLSGLRFLHVFLRWDTAKSDSMKKASWSKQGGGLVRIMPKEQNSVGEDARCMRKLCFGQHLGEKHLQHLALLCMFWGSTFL